MAALTYRYCHLMELYLILSYFLFFLTATVPVPARRIPNNTVQFPEQHQPLSSKDEGYEDGSLALLNGDLPCRLLTSFTPLNPKTIPHRLIKQTIHLTPYFPIKKCFENISNAKIHIPKCLHLLYNV